jgi:ferredoxin
MSIYLLFAIFLLIAAVELVLSFWKGFSITEKLRKQVVGLWIVLWAVLGLALFFPWSHPDPPEYITGSPVRFDGMDHGFSRAMMGVLGPNVSQAWRLYRPDGWDPNLPPDEGNFTRVYPLTRTLFGGNELMQHYRNSKVEGGGPVGGVLHYPAVKDRVGQEKLPWNGGDEIFAEVARELGYSDLKARHTPEENALMIMKISKWLGADEAGVFRFDPRFAYSFVMPMPGTPLRPGEAIASKDLEKYTYGIQVITDQDWERTLFDSGHSWWSISHSGAAYSTSAWIANRVAAMLRDMGYNAVAEHGEFWYETIETPGSVYSGLGEYGRLSDVVVPTSGGLRFKSATVLTDMPLKVEPRKYVGCDRFCEYCSRCARACPVDAIPLGQKTEHNGVTMWHVDKDKCGRYRIGSLTGSCCNECLKVCPYNKPPTTFHKVGNYMVRHSVVACWMFGDQGLGLEDFLDFTNTGALGDNKPARWTLEPKNFKMQFPYVVGDYVYTEDQRSNCEEWATGVGATMGKVGLAYKGIRWGEIPENLKGVNVHTSLPTMRAIPTDVPLEESMKFLPGKVVTLEEAAPLIKRKKEFLEKEKELYKHYGKEIGVRID